MAVYLPLDLSKMREHWKVLLIVLGLAILSGLLYTRIIKDNEIFEHLLPRCEKDEEDVNPEDAKRKCREEKAEWKKERVQQTVPRL